MTKKSRHMSSASHPARSVRHAFPGWPWVALALAALVGYDTDLGALAAMGLVSGAAGAVLFMLLSGLVLARFTPSSTRVA